MVLNALIGAGVSAGASFLSGMFGKSAEEKRYSINQRNQDRRDVWNQQLSDAHRNDVRARAEAAAQVPIVTTSKGRVDMAGFMEAAEKNGFNPLTFLRNGGLQLFAETRQEVTGSTAMDAALAGSQFLFQHSAAQQYNVPTNGEVFGNALTSGANAFTQQMSQNAQNDFQMKLLNAQLLGQERAAARRAGHGGNSPRLGVPSAYLSGSTVKRSTGSLLGNSVAKQFKDPGDSICLLGVCYTTDRGTSSADSAETRYGELGGYIMGGIAAGADIIVPTARAIAGAGKSIGDAAGTSGFADWLYKRGQDLYNEYKLSVPVGPGNYGSNTGWSNQSW